MLKPSILTVALISLPIVSPILITSCSATHQRESTGQYIDGTVITTKVKSKLLADDYVHGLPITVKTYKNTVQLSGFVNNRFQKERAVEIARSVQGVADVEDALVIKNR